LLHFLQQLQDIHRLMPDAPICAIFTQVALGQTIQSVKYSWKTPRTTEFFSGIRCHLIRRGM